MKNLTIIGLGNIGEVFARELKPYFNITVANRSDKSQLAKKLSVKFTQNIPNSVKNADYVVLSVSISGIRDVVHKIKLSVPKTAVVMDTCAVKTYPLKIMSKLPCKVIGAHPQFRNAPSLKGKSIILIGRDKFFENVLQRTGLKIERMNATEHDKKMAIISIAGLVGLNLIEMLSKQERAILKKYSGKASKNLVNLIESMEENSLAMYEDIQRFNPYSKELRKRFLKEIRALDNKMGDN